MRRHLGTTALRAGLLAGTLDGAAAVVQAWTMSRVEPAAVFRFVASGAFGPDARAGGADMVCWGVLLHYLIATLWAALFVVLAARLPRLRRHWLTAGIAYGALVWTVMNLVVLPLSRAALLPRTTPRVLIGMGILMACVGVPVAWLVARRHPAGTAAR